MMDYNKLLKQLYNNPESPAAFSGIVSLWHEARKINKDIPRSAVQNFLEGHRTYTLMRPKRVHFPRSKTIAAGFMTDVQVDLADFQALSRHNKGNRYLLLGIDVLSKRLFGVPVKAKKSEDMLGAFKLLLTQMPMKPHRIFSDKGLEFRNKLLKEYFEKEEIQKIEPAHSTVKASLAERAIRNVKQRLYRYFSQNIILNWIDVLPKILEGINKSKCRVHGMRPIDVNFENAQEVWKKIYGEFDFTKGKPKFKEGEHVRMSVGKGAFEKGYIPNWGDEILEVDQVYNQAKPIRYKVRDDKGEKFKGFFYGEELARVRKDADTEYRIEKVYRKRKRADGTYELLVKYIGYPEREWISESQLV
uniref:Integrase catalytic domain-containing protein n=1 Tax=Meloidogyne incognita TaxID=6306 RepID=A0A914NGP6_MELIC